MKYYKLMYGKGWASYKEGKIYSEDFRNVKIHATNDLYTRDWKEVSKEEYLLQEELLLPEKWTVKADISNVNALEKWLQSKKDLNDDFKYLPKISNCWVLSEKYSDNSYQNWGQKLPYSYTEITFKQFKKYVLKEDTMEKEIKGYRMIKPEFLYAAINITDFNLNPDRFISYMLYARNKGSAEQLRKAGVLDLWFEPVYEEVIKFQVGDWVMYDSTDHKAGPYKLSKIDGKFSKDSYNHTKNLESKNYRFATNHEIFEALSNEFLKKHDIEIGKKYYFTHLLTDGKEQTNLITLKGLELIIREKSDGTYSYLNHDWFRNNPNEKYQLQIKADGGTYNPDVSISKTDVKPKVTIKGYKANIGIDSVQFGCQTYTKQFVLELGKFLKDSGLNIESKEEIMKIYNYYKNGKG